MNILKDFLFEVDYVLEIFDDIEKTFYELNEDVNIYDVYNKQDIRLLIKIFCTCSNSLFRQCNKNLSYIDIPNLINYYNDFTFGSEIEENPKQCLEKIVFEKNHIFDCEGKKRILLIKEALKDFYNKV